MINSEILENELTWFENYRKKNNRFWPNEERTGRTKHYYYRLIRKERLKNIAGTIYWMKNEFLSPGGIRALSKYHQEHPYSVTIDGIEYSIHYDPG